MADNRGVVAHGVGDDAKYNIVPMYWGGHSLYCRKCERAEVINGIVLPDSVRNFRDKSFAWLEVLGIGPNVGKPCTKLHMRTFRRAKCLDVGIEVGDLVMCPNRSPCGQGILISPLVGENISKSGHFDGEEFFIEESIPVAIHRK